MAFKIDQKWVSLVTSLLPVVLMFFPGFPNILIPTVIHGIAEAEALGETGANKKQHVLELVRTAGEAINLAKKRTVVNLERDLPTIEKAIDVAISVVNLVHRGKA